MTKYPVLLVILDGFGYSKKRKYNAIYQAHSEFFLYLLKHYPHTLLKASGRSVGQLDNMIGNSEVGHLAMGTGRVIKQPISIICEQINNNKFFNNNLLLNKFKKLAKSNKSLHIMGLLSDAGVHSSDKHLYALIKMAVNNNIKNIVIHVFLDGRDSPPKSAGKYLINLENFIENLNKNFNKSINITIGSIHGRFYAMDRDKNWQRTSKSYKVLTNSSDKLKFNTWQQALEYYYNQNLTDEFILPTLLNKNANIKSGDGVIFFNFRADRARQLTEALTNKRFDKFKINPIDFIWFITFTNYFNKNYKNKLNIDILLEKELIKNTLLDILEKENKTIFTIAETEKYAHVTYFFNGGREKLRNNETRILVKSIPKKTYIYHPEMSAQKITTAVLESLKSNPQDFYVINYANADMVGHSGDFNATVKAIRFLDKQIKQLYDTAVLKHNGTLYITGDHGNAEEMWDLKTNQPNTSHTNNLVYFLIVNQNLFNKKLNLKELHQLSDIAPFILKSLNLPVPGEMQ